MMIKKIECPTIAQDRFQFILPRGYFQRTFKEILLTWKRMNSDPGLVIEVFLGVDYFKIMGRWKSGIFGFSTQGNETYIWIAQIVALQKSIGKMPTSNLFPDLFSIFVGVCVGGHPNQMNWWTLTMVKRHWGVLEGSISQWGTCVYCITAKLEALELSSGILLRANDKCGPRYYEPQNEYLGKILQNAVGMTYLPLWFLWNKIKMWLIWCWIMTGVQISY